MANILKAMRVEHWLKNVLLFVPALAAHRLPQSGELWKQFAAFIAFSAIASGVYIVNDLRDLEADRRHHRKRNRPFASGALKVSTGRILSPLLFITGVGISVAIGHNFAVSALVYFIVTTAYTFRLKKIVLIDCMTLAFLYTLRIIAGATIMQISLSFWLVACASFLFLSLAFVKRFAELKFHEMADTEIDNGRSYRASDIDLVQIIGIGSGFISVLVLALYMNTDSVSALYKSPLLLLATVPVLFYWIAHLWLKSERGEMHDDPLVFAVRDPNSLFSGLLFVAIMVVSSKGWFL